MKRLVCWGGDRSSNDSFRWIWEAYQRTANKLGIPSVWMPDIPEAHPHIFPGDTVLGVDIWGRNIPYVKGAKYVLHNFSIEHPLPQALDGDFLRLQVWTTDAFGEKWDDFRQFDREAKVLFQPWGSALLAEEFMEPVFNAQSRDVVFVGAVWSDVRNGVDLGNESAIEELREACEEHGLNFVHYTQIPETEMIQLTREARLAPTVVGKWQCDHSYLPCRAFKHASWGVPVLTNSGAVSALFNGDEADTGVAEMIEWALRLKQNDYLTIAREDQRVAARYSYRESIESIDRALEEIE